MSPFFDPYDKLFPMEWLSDERKQSSCSIKYYVMYYLSSKLRLTNLRNCSVFLKVKIPTDDDYSTKVKTFLKISEQSYKSCRDEYEDYSLTK